MLSSRNGLSVVTSLSQATCPPPPPELSQHWGCSMDAHDTALHSHHGELAALRARVSKLEQVERDLRAELRRVFLMQEAAPYLIQVCDPVEQRKLYENRSLARELGYATDETALDGLDAFMTLVHPDDHARIHEQLNLVRRGVTSDTMEIEVRLRRADGSWCWLTRRDIVLERDAATPRQIMSVIQDITAHKETEAEQRRQAEDLSLSKRLVDNALDGITLTSMSGEVVYANLAFKNMSGFGDGAVGRGLVDFYSPASFTQLSTEVLPALTKDGVWRGVLRIRRPDGSEWMGQTSAFVLSSPTGQPTGMAAFFRDITEQLRYEQETLAQMQVIQAQQAALRELGTPLVPIADGVIAMPLVGAIDGERAQQILETLLRALGEKHAAVAILDITGVKAVDGEVAAALVRVAQAARLLGADVVLTGIRPVVAQALVDLGAELRGLVTCGTLQSGIAYALKRKARPNAA
ncbi:PAS domain S-box protein [Sorangium sp. So ce131]|uniref:PAS domain S-box protein n=1 Tax=Sorangium sp. So ce131 TaxID=3133282 RepID=UPI003F61547D